MSEGDDINGGEAKSDEGIFSRIGGSIRSGLGMFGSSGERPTSRPTLRRTRSPPRPTSTDRLFNAEQEQEGTRERNTYLQERLRRMQEAAEKQESEFEDGMELMRRTFLPRDRRDPQRARKKKPDDEEDDEPDDEEDDEEESGGGSKRCSKYKKRIQKLEAELETVKGNLEIQVGERQRFQAENAGLVTENARLTGLLAAADAVNTTNVSNSADLYTVRGENNQLKGDLAQAKSDVNFFKQKADSLKQDNERFQKMNKTANDTITGLQQQLGGQGGGAGETKVQGLINQNTDLKLENSDLERKNGELSRIFEEQRRKLLEEVNPQMDQQYANLLAAQKEATQLRAELAQAKADRNSIEQQAKRLLEQYRQENASLRAQVEQSGGSVPPLQFPDGGGAAKSDTPSDGGARKEPDGAVSEDENNGKPQSQQESGVQQFMSSAADVSIAVGTAPFRVIGAAGSVVGSAIGGLLGITGTVSDSPPIDARPAIPENGWEYGGHEFNGKAIVRAEERGFKSVTDILNRATSDQVLEIIARGNANASNAGVIASALNLDDTQSITKMRAAIEENWGSGGAGSKQPARPASKPKKPAKKKKSTKKNNSETPVEKSGRSKRSTRNDNPIYKGLGLHEGSTLRF